jgi:endoglucanase
MERKYLKDLVMLPSLSGYEFMTKQYIERTYGKDLIVRADSIGNQYLMLAEKDPGKPTIMISAHIDEIGYVLTHKNSDGLWEFRRRGGIDLKVTEGQVIDCWPDPINRPDWKVQGIIGKVPIHLEDPEARKKADTIHDLLIDFGDQEGPEIGSPCLPVKHWTELGSDLISAPGLDDKAGCAVILDVMMQMKSLLVKLDYNLVGVLMVQEEVGLRGANIAASKIDPDISIDLDVSFATDEGRSIKEIPAGSVKLGAGPILSYGPDKDFRLMKELASLGVKIQETVTSAGGTNTSAIQLNSRNAKTALISIPQRNMHTPVEVCSWSDLEACSDLLFKYLRKYRV